MALGPQNIEKKPETVSEYADLLELQIDAWLMFSWMDPSHTCYQVPHFFQRFPNVLDMVLERYRKQWPHIHIIPPSNAYSCYFIAFVTKPCERREREVQTV